MNRLVFATGNQGKMREIREILGDSIPEILSMKEAGIVADIVEDGKTFEENALIKARAVSKAGGIMAMADDSGLEVDCMGGAPGIYSARFMGEDTSYDIKNNYIIGRAMQVPPEERTARFVCAIACVLPDGREWVVRGTVEGMINDRQAGENGFGYDPIFLLPERGVTTAQLPPEEKNAISHRGRALRAMRELLTKEGIL
ncbi:MAG: RdgB/HAM1 family non-canonical purine NTP pyrophosphatase [Lachnospiraceae bacterium]|nr:RdgB/HAM1 family non-canonical purine NTP pyrophosphatase [Lachnospiraceae bacterium]